MVQPIKLSSNKCDLDSVKLNSWAVPSYHVSRVACDKRSRCCMWVAHNCTRATWAFLLKTVHCAKSRLSKISVCTFQCDYNCYYKSIHRSREWLHFKWCCRKGKTGECNVMTTTAKDVESNLAVVCFSKCWLVGWLLNTPSPPKQTHSPSPPSSPLIWRIWVVGSSLCWGFFFCIFFFKRNFKAAVAGVLTLLLWECACRQCRQYLLFCVQRPLSYSCDHLTGLVVKASASEAEGPAFESHFQQDFSRSSHTSDLIIGTPVVTLPGAWRYRVSSGTGRPGVSILWLGEVESCICNFYLSVAAHKIVWADPFLRYTSMLLGC